MASFLDKLVRGKIAGPVKLVVYGPPGTGKSTFAAGAPNPLFFDFEGRTKHLDVPRVPAKTWPEVGAAMKEIIANPGEFKTIVFDTLDAMEDLVHKWICEQGGVTSIEDYDKGFGKGYVAAYGEFTRFLALVEQMIARGLNVVMLAHPVLSKYQNPAGEDYDVWKIKLRGGAKSDVPGLVIASADLVGYASFEDLARKGKSDTKAKSLTTGNRILNFKHHPAFNSKAGVPLSKLEIPLTWAALTEALK